MIELNTTCDYEKISNKTKKNTNNLISIVSAFFEKIASFFQRKDKFDKTKFKPLQKDDFDIPRNSENTLHEKLHRYTRELEIYLINHKNKQKTNEDKDVEELKLKRLIKFYESQLYPDPNNPKKKQKTNSSTPNMVQQKSFFVQPPPQKNSQQGELVETIPIDNKVIEKFKKCPEVYETYWN